MLNVPLLALQIHSLSVACSVPRGQTHMNYISELACLWLPVGFSQQEALARDWREQARSQAAYAFPWLSSCSTTGCLSSLMCRDLRLQLLSIGSSIVFFHVPLQDQWWQEVAHHPLPASLPQPTPSEIVSSSDSTQ